MKLNAVQTHEEICKWIASTKTEQQLLILSSFVDDTFSKKYPSNENDLHAQMRTNMINKIQTKWNEVSIPQEVRQRFPATDEHIEYTKPVNDKYGH